MTKSKSAVRLMQGILLILLFFSVVLSLNSAGIITNVGEENIYWERARLLLGQSGANSYNGSVLCSIGYSLVLLPICALIESTYAAHKAAVLLNGIFLCASFIISIMTTKKIWANEKEGTLTLASFLCVICPIFAVDRVFTGPDMILMFLVWVCIYTMVLIRENYNTKKIAVLAGILVLISFLDIVLLPFIVGIAVSVLVWNHYNKIEEKNFFLFLIFLILGVIVGVVFEQLLLQFYIGKADGVSFDSLKVFSEGILNGWEALGLQGIFTGIVGKLFSILLGSFLFVAPGAALAVKVSIEMIRKRKKMPDTEQMICGSFLLAFLFQLIFSCLYDSSSIGSVGFSAIRNIKVLLPFLIVLGVIQIGQSKEWLTELMIYLAVFCGCAFVTATHYGDKTDSASVGIKDGILFLFQRENLDIVASIYLAAGIVLVLSILIWFLAKVKCRKNAGKHLFFYGSVLFSVILFGTLNEYIVSESVGKLTNWSMDNIASVASILAEKNAEETIYFIDGTVVDDDVAVLQSLMPQNEVKMLNQYDSIPDDVVLVSGADEDTLTEIKLYYLQDYSVLCATDALAVWSKAGTEVYQKLNENIEQRISKMFLSNTEKNKWKYGGDVTLASGTYHINLVLKLEEMDEAFSGKVTIKDSDGIVLKQTLSLENFNNSGEALVSLMFSSRDVLREFAVEIEETSTDCLEISSVYYQKVSSVYSVGANSRNVIEKISRKILMLDQKCTDIGRITYVEDSSDNGESVSIACFGEQLPDYEMSIVTQAELKEVESEYLIGNTYKHAYIEAMDNYSVIYRNAEFTVLVRNDSQQYEKYLETNGGFLSTGRMLDAKTLYAKNAEIEYAISLEPGTYEYHGELQYHGEGAIDTEFAETVYLMNGEEVLAEKVLTVYDLTPTEQGTLRFSIPFTLRKKSNELYCTFISELEDDFVIKPLGVELTSAKYQYGQEENLSDFYELINQLGDDTSVFIAHTADVLLAKEYEYTRIRENIPDANVRPVNFETANLTEEDTLLISWGFSKNTLKLLDKYSIIDQSGRYTLWVRSDGELIQRAVALGAEILSSANKISVESISDAAGMTYQENVISYLPNNRYRITLELEVNEAAVSEDTFVLTLLNEQDEKALKEEMDELIANGYTEKEALELVSVYEKCGSKTYELHDLDEAKRMIVTVDTSGKVSANNMICKVSSWLGTVVKAKIVWVEVL